MTNQQRPTGLSRGDVIAARRSSGWNELPEPEQTGLLAVLFRQFASFLVIILIVAAVLALALGEWIDAIAIMLVVLLNAVLGFVQEWRAENALAALRQFMTPKALVVRDGQEISIPARELVPGDFVILGPGDKVPADLLLRHAVDLRVDESILTGESMPVPKSADAPANQLFAGTSVVAGRAEACVNTIGAKTEFGKIAGLTALMGPNQTNLQRKLSGLAKQLGIAALLAAASVMSLGLWVGRDPLEMVMTGLSLSVAMVPEGLPAVVTITLALGAAAMVRRNALVRRLQAVETLGAASVICTDKTGTLTENKMTATQIWSLSGTYDVTGTGYDPAGHIERNGQRIRATDDPVLETLLTTGLFCSHARLFRDGTDWKVVGEPTEIALVTLAYKGWTPLPDTLNLLSEIPFSSERKRMSVLYRSDTGAQIYTKGAPEQVLELCTKIQDRTGTLRLTAENRATVETAYREMARQGLRVMALAYRSAPDHQLIEDRMTFLGLVGLIDPPRKEVKAAIRAAKAAGLRVIMITGDSPVTAAAIADRLEIPVSQCLTGSALEDLDSDALTEVLGQNVLFARTKPEHKMRIVGALQAQGQIVAMTGDGVNDAPALKKADIGIAMGIRGTDVARDASDLVLLDDNFATIVRAISEGRRQFANVQKFVRYLLSSNAGEVIALMINIVIGGPLIFLATQILWMNLVTDGVTAVALGLEKSEPDQMQRPPRSSRQPILGWRGIATIGLVGLYTGLSSLWIFLELLDQSLEIARTTAFTAMVVFEKTSVFAFRSLHLPGWRIGWLSNPLLLLALAVTMGAQVLAVYWEPLQILLRTVPLGTDEWILIVAFALPILIVPEIIKSMMSRNHRPT